MKELQNAFSVSPMGEGYAIKMGWDTVYQCEYYCWGLETGDFLTPSEVTLLEGLVSHHQDDILALTYQSHSRIEGTEPIFELHVTYQDKTIELAFKEEGEHYVLEPFFTYFLPSNNAQYLNTLMWMFLAVHHCPLTIDEVFTFHERFPLWLQDKEVIGYPSKWGLFMSMNEETVLHF